ncbi:MAG TPA: L,D-transpeptidase [Acidimicrobiia bacterium]
MSRRAPLLLVSLLALAACGDVPVARETATELAVPTLTVNDVAPFGSPAPVDTRPTWEGFAATTTDPGALTAMVHGPLEVFETPGAAEPMHVIGPETILGTVTVLGVATAPVDGWVELMLPVRPNGTTGWARAENLSYYVSDGLIVVDLDARELTYVVDGVEVLSTEVGVGSRHNETPPGEYFVTDVVTMSNPNSPWGPHALGLSAHSETITEFNGGDGIIGIHGTNNPSSIGANISLGCIRLPNEMITALHGMVAIGTRVVIEA